MTRQSFILALAAFWLIAAANGFAANAGQNLTYSFCGPPLESNAFGKPLDYNDPANDAHIHSNVEVNHFDRNVETLVRGKTGVLPLDIAYVLRQIPNHHRALAAMAKWERREGYQPRVMGQDVYTADCYFRRALNFMPEDNVVHMLYGMYLHNDGKLEAALREYLAARSYNSNNVELNYNLGLLYFDMGEYDKARESALFAYEKGFPLFGLRSKLQRVGKWQD